VFRLNGIDDSDDEGGMAEYEHEDDSDEEEEVPTAKTETAQRKGKGKKRKVVESSSEEGNSESEEETWGRSRGAYYASKADQLDPEDEEANELQEKEARMLQAKARDDMVEADFGLEDPVQRRKDKGDE
jgi:U3 small nucleolar RNA-associated protein 3